jgi:RND superfamily putative drug exporter
MNALVRATTGRRTAWIVALVGLVLAMGVTFGLGEAERNPSPTDSLPAGSDSTLGVELQQQLPEDDEAAAIVLFTADDGIEALLPELEQALADAREAIGGTEPQGQQGGEQGQPGGEQGQPGGGQGGPPAGLQPSEDGTAALGVLTVPSATASETAQSVGDLREALRASVPDGVEVQVTGPAAIEADLAGVFQGANTTLLMVTALVVAFLLIVTYRSPVLWLVPLVVVGVADRLAAVLATQLLAAFGVPWDESTIGILSVLVFGAGTNYALLIISRYRDELRAREDRHEAMAIALRRASEAVLNTATTVVVGVLMLLLSVVPATRGLGLATAVGVVTAAVFVLLVLPPALVVFGRWIFWPKVPRVGEAALTESRTIWTRIGDRVAARPGAFIVGTFVFLALAAIGLTQVRLGLSTEEQFLDRPEAITAAERVAESFPAGSADPTVVVIGSEDEQTVGEVLAAVEEVEGVDTVTPSGAGGGVTQLNVILSDTAGSEGAVTAIQDIRSAVSDVPDVHVTGSEAQAIDADDGAARDRLVIMPLVLGLVLLALVGLLRSLLAPAILVGTVVASFAASMGLSWWLFTGVLGFSALDSSVPLLSFLFLVALGVDYNVFLITRTVEETKEHGTRRGVLRALSATGGVITSAGILLAAVFAVLGVLPLVVLAQVGTVICLGVLLDTLLVRTVLVPAIVLKLGDTFWWPRKVRPVEAAAPVEG